MADIDYSDQVDITALMAAIAAPLGGARIQHGTFTLTVGTSAVPQSVAFPTAFAATPRVFCTVIDTAAATSGGRSDRWGSASGASGGDGTTTGFWFQSSRETGSASIRVNWIAIGA